ncbi:MAG: hypothetical protein EA422_15090 [Gemmatimonadales bacterium]|nr:MAG: hypothetical protein EA422_15090 [Gemmatimonadales bacterium]
MALRSVLLALAAVLLLGDPAAAQQSPADFHGRELGSRFLILESMDAYYRHLDAESPRVVYESYGRSGMGRPLPVLFVSSEENLARREEIREATHLLTHRTDPLAEEELERLVRDTPATVWVFILDSANENPGPEALQEVAWELATREDETARRIRDNLLIAIMPMATPDAQVKYVNWHAIYDIPGSSRDPNAIQNRPHWGISSDGNVFGIDMNRDFTWFTTPETRAMARFGVRWRPQAILDLHTGPDTFFMTPTGPPYHPLWPAENLKWARAATARAGEHFSREGFLISSGMQYAGITYLGHGLTWALMGTVVTGQFVESFGGVNPDRPRPDGTVATLRDATDRTGLATWAHLEVKSERREELLRDAYEVAIRSAAEARTQDVRTVIIPAEGEGVDPDKVQRLVDRLALQGIQVHRTTEGFTASAMPFLELDAGAPRSFPAGTFVVDLVQPFSRLARAVLDPTLQYGVPEVDPWLGRASPFYDAQIENLPLLFGVAAYASTGPVEAARQPYGEGEGWARPWSADRAAAAADAFGYVIPTGLESSARLVTTLMAEGYRIRVANAPFRLGEREFPQGTWVTLADRNSSTLGTRLLELAGELDAPVVPVAGSLTDGGVTLANPQLVVAVPQPRVAVVADHPVSFDHVWGGIRSSLEGDLGFPFTPVLAETLNRGDLREYTTIVLPDARGWEGRLEMENLRAFVRAGGTVVAAKGAAEALARDPVLGAGIEAQGRATNIFGAILRAEWHHYDPAEPGARVPWEPGIRVGQPLMSTGLPREFAAPASQPVLLELAEDGGAQVLASYGSDPDRIQLDGFLWEPDRDSVVGRPLVVRHPVGQGQVIYLADDITYRGLWYGLNLTFLNALVLGPLG